MYCREPTCSIGKAYFRGLNFFSFSSYFVMSKRYINLKVIFKNRRIIHKGLRSKSSYHQFPFLFDYMSQIKIHHEKLIVSETYTLFLQGSGCMYHWNLATVAPPRPHLSHYLGLDLIGLGWVW